MSCRRRQKGPARPVGGDGDGEGRRGVHVQRFVRGSCGTRRDAIVTGSGVVTDERRCGRRADRAARTRDWGRSARYPAASDGIVLVYVSMFMRGGL